MSKEQIEEMAKVIAEVQYLGGLEEKVAEHLYNAGYRKNEWISVEERLPKFSTYILVYSEKRKEILFCYYGAEEEWWIDDGWASAEYWGITHWMPLPEAPKMKGGAE